MVRIPEVTKLQMALKAGRKKQVLLRICELLREGNADAQVQAMAAEMLTPKPRGRPPSLPRDWFEIAQRFEDLRSEGMKYEDAMLEVIGEFGTSDGHVRGCLKIYREAEDEDRN
ncbi:hypothetical protein ACLBXM_02700 [Xanthobacteraceae bacterium A53D]